jgi:4-hydroxy-2-oxoglutarate aldolase
VSYPEISLAGVFPPIVTPFTADGELDYDHLQTNFAIWNQKPLAGYVVQGSNGEAVHLSEAERVGLIQAARELTPPDRLLIAGSGAESTRATIDLTRRMAAAGADVAIVVTPGYYAKQMDAATLENHYLKVAEAAPIPIMLYSVPANTGVDMEPAAVIRLAGHPNIIGLKDSGGNVTKIGFMVQETPADFQILAGSAGFLLGALSVGAVGGVVALANIAATETARLVEAVQRGDFVAARRAQGPLIEVNTAVTARFGVPGLKAAMDMLGYYGGPPREPLLPLPEKDQVTLRKILGKAGLLAESMS